MNNSICGKHSLCKCVWQIVFIIWKASNNNNHKKIQRWSWQLRGGPSYNICGLYGHIKQHVWMLGFQCFHLFVLNGIVQLYIYYLLGSLSDLVPLWSCFRIMWATLHFPTSFSKYFYFKLISTSVDFLSKIYTWGISLISTTQNVNRSKMIITEI